MSSLEKRLISRVQPLKSEKQGITRVIQSTDLTQLPHNHEKGKQCRSCRTLRKLAKLEKEKEVGKAQLDFAKESSIGSVTALVHGLTEIVKTALDGSLKTAAAVAGNQDPVAQGVAIGAGGITLIWFVSAFPNLAKLLHLDSLVIQGEKITGFVQQPSKPDIQIPAAGTGEFCIQWSPQEWVQIVESVSGFPTAGQEACFTTREERDKQLGILRNDATKNWYWTFTPVDHLLPPQTSSTDTSFRH